MRWASAISDAEGPQSALEAVSSAIGRQLDRVDLAVVFASSPLATDGLAKALKERLRARVVVGCSAGGVIGDGREIEFRPALSVTAASLPGVGLHPFHVDSAQLPEPDDAAGFRALAGPGEPSGVLVLADPFTSDAQALISGLDAALPRAAKFGGLCSGGRAPMAHRLYLDAQTFRSGAVGVSFSGPLFVDTLVAQGCRPIGTPMLITRCEGHEILELNGRPPLEVLRTLYEAASEDERKLFRHSLFAGVEMKDSVVHQEGELLVRNIVGMAPETGALAIAARVKPFQVMQFLLRDARTAEEDLTRLLGRYRDSGRTASGALLFSCLGRGENLFGAPDHDTALMQKMLGKVPLGGFFCNGEIGPVGGSTYLHGYTSAFALFRPKE